MTRLADSVSRRPSGNGEYLGYLSEFERLCSCTRTAPFTAQPTQLKEDVMLARIRSDGTVDDVFVVTEHYSYTRTASRKRLENEYHTVLRLRRSNTTIRRPSAHRLAFRQIPHIACREYQSTGGLEHASRILICWGPYAAMMWLGIDHLDRTCRNYTRTHANLYAHVAGPSRLPSGVRRFGTNSVPVPLEFILPDDSERSGLQTSSAHRSTSAR